MLWDLSCLGCGSALAVAEAALMSVQPGLDPVPCRVPVCKTEYEAITSEDLGCLEGLCGLDVQVRATAWWR